MLRETEQLVFQRPVLEPAEEAVTGGCWHCAITLELAAEDTGRQKLLLLFITALLRVRPLAAAAAAACAMKRSLAALVLTTLLLELTEPLELLLDVEEAGVPAVKKPLLAPLKSLPIRSGLLRCWCDWCSCWELLW